METSKTCTKCKKIKELKLFYKKKASKDGYDPACKQCNNDIVDKHFKTKNGILSRIYGAQKTNSKQRKHSPPTYTKQELKEWLFNQKLFHELFDKWVDSGYLKDLKPSIDRKDDYKGYTLLNIQLMTWDENNSKGYSDRKNGINTKQNRAIFQYDLNNKLIKEYSSIKDASIELSIDAGNICDTCKGNRNSAGGYIWKYLI